MTGLSGSRAVPEGSARLRQTPAAQQHKARAAARDLQLPESGRVPLAAPARRLRLLHRQCDLQGQQLPESPALSAHGNQHRVHLPADKALGQDSEDDRVARGSDYRSENHVHDQLEPCPGSFS
jgi:hypothetical protein